MKRLLQLLILCLCLGVSLPSQAQFFKKLSDKVQDAAEDKVINKSANKTSQTVDKGMDDVFSVGKKKTKKNKKEAKKNQPNQPASTSSAKQPRESYLFSYLYVAEMQTNQADINAEMDFFLTPGADYLGIRVEQQGSQIFMVMDYPKSTNFSFISSPSGDIVMPNNLNFNDNTTSDKNQADFKITDLPNKTILGYSCKGKQLEDEEWSIKFYYTDEVPINMSNIFKADTKNEQVNPVVKNQLSEMSNGLIMEMEAKNKQKPDENYIMKAKSLEKVDYNFKTSGFNTMSY